MGNNRYVVNQADSRINTKCGTLTVVTTDAKRSYTTSVKSHLKIRSTQDLQASRVPAYSYLIP